MGYAISIDLVKQGLIDRIDDLVPYLYPAAELDGAEWRLGSIHGEPGRSLMIHRVGYKTGWWKDFAGSDKGDVLDLVACAMTDGDVGAAIRESIRWLGLEGMDEDARRRAERQAADARAVKARREAGDLERKAASAKRHWLNAVPLRLQGGGLSLAGEYLCHRGLDLYREPQIRLNALRSHPGLIDPETRTERPCLVAAACRLKGGLVTIHRTFLERLPGGVVVKARAMQKPKRAYSAYKGAFISIHRGQSGKPIGAMEPGEWIAITEGIEDAVAIAMARPQVRVVSAISLSNIGALDLPRDTGGVWIHRHRGDPPEAEEAYEKAVAELRRRGLDHIRPLWAPDGYKDFTEVFEAAQRQRLSMVEADKTASGERVS